MFLQLDLEPKSTMDMSLIPSIDPIDIDLGSSDKGNPNPSAKPRKKTLTSVYLKLFETAADGKSRRCKFCGQSYCIGTATGNCNTIILIDYESECLKKHYNYSTWSNRASSIGVVNFYYKT